MSIKKITESGFYNLKDFKNISKIEIEKNLEVIIFDDGLVDKEVLVGDNSNLKICGFLEHKEDFNIIVKQIGEKSDVEIRYLLFAKDSRTQAKIHSKVENNLSKSDVSIVSLAAENGEIDLDGVIELAPNFVKISGHLVEENLFLGEKGKIRGIPTLLVKSNEVEASHACKIEKISDEKLFYMRARGIRKDNSVYILIESKVKNTFKFIENQDFFEDFVENILQKIF